MDKNAIKKYAIWARRELIEKVSQKALQYGIEEGKELDPKLDSINGVLLTDDEKKQRQALIRKINENGYIHVMEEVAYTWFNRFIALRFMEVNGYLPSHVRVFTDEAGDFKPQIMSEALHLELEGLDMEKVYELKNDNRDDDLFKYLLITQCNSLSGIFPKMFQKISDYTELLLPDYLLREGSVIEQMVNQKEGIPEADWQDQVQIIGWLYQYYNTEPKDKVFADLKKNVKITKEKIPAATQLFTPDWIVHYMVENSLGRLWLEGHPNNTLKSEWKYYLDEAEQEPDVQKQLDEIRKEYAGLKPEEIKCIDPCMGSGHILCVLFDTLIKIYEDYGYPARDAAASIVENNLWGLDIDERAAQLAYFAVMMKARQYDRRFLTRGIQPHVYAIEESNGLKYDGDYGDFRLDNQQQETLSYMFDVFKDAKEYGSILNVENRDYDSFINAWKLIAEQTMSDVRMMGWYMYAGDKIDTLAYQAKALSQKYHVVVTNPPYMSSSGMSAKLTTYMKKNYEESKYDLFAAFIERCRSFCKINGFHALITQHSWLFLSSYEKLRSKIMIDTIVNMAHLGARAFDEIGGEVVSTTSFVICKARVNGYAGTYCRLTEPTSENGKSSMLLSGKNRYYRAQDELRNIPGTPLAYWVSDALVNDFKVGKPFAEIGFPKVGMQTSNNDKFLRLWHEVRADEFFGDSKKWIKYIKGGSYRRWYGNLEYVVWYNGTPSFIMQQKNARVLPESELEVIKCTWTDLATSRYSSRVAPKDSFHDISGHCFYPSEDDYYYLLAFTNSCVFQTIIDMLNSSLHYQVGDVARTPVIISDKDKVSELAKQAVELSKEDWDSFETSWDFVIHPLISDKKLLSDAYDDWKEKADNRFEKLKQIEEEINTSFIKGYFLDTELTAEVLEKDITVRKANLIRDIKSFISYAVGCMFGRYSLDNLGIIYAGGTWDSSVYKKYSADSDAIIPICDDEYFDDDIVGRFVKFVGTVYGEETLEENLKYIADALGGKGSSREIIRNYFINDFYSDHLKMYQKRPIYWLFDSGKKNGFKCLVYMHRYHADTIARIRTDYVHEQQARYRTVIEEISKRIDNVSSSEKMKLNKRLNALRDQDEEIHVYEEKIHHLADQMISINLDDGVKHNYALLQDVLAKI